MFSKPKSLIKQMNIHSDTLIINQCNNNDYEELEVNNSNIKVYSFNERGVGLSRNNALMRATGDICIFADDDIKYLDNSEEIIINEFKNHPEADIIIFNVPVTNKDRKVYFINKFKKVKFYNCLRYCTYRIAFRNEAIKKKNIYFSLLFGGGAKYGSGEDSLFIYNCIKSGLRVYSSPKVIGEVTHKTSTWFSGYNEKYFKDKGALFYAISNKYGKLYCLYYLLRHRKKVLNQLNFTEAKRKMYEGISEFKKEVR